MIDTAIREALADDDGFQLLGEMMEVSHRFHFFILVCDTPRVTQAALTTLRERIEAARGTRVPVSTIDPYAAPDVSLAEPLPPEFLLGFVLPRLHHPNRWSGPGEDFLVLDASRSIGDDDRAWSILFQRMNEQRNTIVRANTGSLVLCITHPLEAIFKKAAPDFWSIRSTAISLAISPSTPPPSDFIKEWLNTIYMTSDRHLPHEHAADLTASAYDPDKNAHSRTYALNILAERDLDRGRPRASIQKSELCLALLDIEYDIGRHVDCLHNMTWAYRFLGEADRALKASYELVATVRTQAAKSPALSDHFGFSGCLVNHAQINRWSGMHWQAATAADEALDEARDLLAAQPERLDIKNTVALGLETRGDISYEIGDILSASTYYDDSLKIKQERIARFPNESYQKFNVAESLLRRALVLWHLAGDAAAFGPCLAALRLLRDAVTNFDAPSYFSHALYLHLANLGNLHNERGDPSRAVLAYKDSLHVCRELVRTDDQNLSWRHIFATSLIRWARHEQAHHGKQPEVTSAWQEARSILAALLAEAPARKDWAELLVECTAALA